MLEFLELSNRVSWHDAALGACFQLGLDYGTIRCDLPMGDFPLIELINLILFLNGSDFEVEEIPESRHPAPAGMRHVSPAHPTPRTPTYLSNGSYRLPNSKNPSFLRSSSIILSPEPPSAAKSSPPATADSSPEHAPVPAPRKRFAVPAPPERPPVHAPPERPSVPAPSEQLPDRAPTFPKKVFFF